MTAKLYHTLFPIAAVSATTAAANYPAANVLTPSVARAWRSTSLASNNVDIDLGVARAGVVLGVQAANVATFTLFHGLSLVSLSSLGAQPQAMDRHGRRKFSYAFAGSVRYIRLQFSGTPDDDAAFFELGAVYAFGATLSLPEDPLIGASDVVSHWPQHVVALPNGNEFAVDRGVPRQAMSLRFRGARTADLAEPARRARVAPCWLDLGVASNRELQWPVRSLAAEVPRNFTRALQDEAALAMIEVA